MQDLASICYGLSRHPYRLNQLGQRVVILRFEMVLVFAMPMDVHLLYLSRSPESFSVALSPLLEGLY